MKDRITALYKLLYRAQRKQLLAQRAGHWITLAEAIRRVQGRSAE